VEACGSFKGGGALIEWHRGALLVRSVLGSGKRVSRLRVSTSLITTTLTLT